MTQKIPTKQNMKRFPPSHQMMQSNPSFPQQSNPPFHQMQSGPSFPQSQPHTSFPQSQPNISFPQSQPSPTFPQPNPPFSPQKPPVPLFHQTSGPTPPAYTPQNVTPISPPAYMDPTVVRIHQLVGFQADRWVPMALYSRCINRSRLRATSITYPDARTALDVGLHIIITSLLNSWPISARARRNFHAPSFFKVASWLSIPILILGTLHLTHLLTSRSVLRVSRQLLHEPYLPSRAKLCTAKARKVLIHRT